MVSNRSFNGLKQLVRVDRLGEEIFRTVHSAHDGRNVGVAGNKQDRKRRTAFNQPRLLFRSAQARHPNIENDAANPALVPQIIQQLLGGGISRDVITSPPEPALKRGSERGIIINDVDRSAEHGRTTGDQ